MVYLMVLLRMALAERSHLIEYGVVASFIYEALAVLATGAVGVLDEGIQVFLPSRVFDPVDMLFNALAGVMAVLVRVVLARVRHRKASIPPGSPQAPPVISGG